MSKQSKVQNVIAKVKECLDSGRYYDTSHAKQRRIERNVSFPHIEWVLRNGYHEKNKDVFKSEFTDWNYSIRGTTIDGKSLRVVVAFDEDGMLIITVVVITKKAL